jgi:hypothetical protein
MTPSLSLAPAAPKRPRAPHSLDLAILFKDFIVYWAGWRISLEDEEPLGRKFTWKEWQIALRGSVQGTLTFRTTDAFLRTLWDTQALQGRDFPSAESSFREMAALYATHMVRSLWQGHFLGLDPLMARPLEASARPSPSQCHTYCRLWMNGEPLEIRFWSEPGVRPIEGGLS